MDKSDFLGAFRHEDSNKMAKLYEFLEHASYQDYFIFLEEFYTRDIWEKVIAMKSYQEITTLGEEDFERKAFAKGQGDCPLVVVMMENLNPQKELKHKDYLGGIMSLGVTREKFGDLFVKKNQGYVVTFPAMANYLKNELTQVGASDISLSIEDYHEIKQELTPTYIISEVIVSSLRLDVLVAEMARCSRKNAVDLIKRGQVLVNYGEVKEKAKEVKEGDTLTIRGKGKYKVGITLGTTKKDNLKISLMKFV